MITSAAVGLELAIVVVLVIALVAVMLFTGSGDVDNLTSRGVTADAPDYFGLGGGLMAGMLMGLLTLVGFDSAANLAEEAKDPFRSVPRAIVSSVVAAGVLGLVFLIALTLAIKDIPGGERRRVAGGRDHPRSARTGRRANHAGGTCVCDVRCRDGGDGRLLTAGVRDGTRRALPGARADAAGQPQDADAGSGDDPDRRHRCRSDGRTAR